MKWHNLDFWQQQPQFTPLMRTWLCEQHSLTQRLRQHCHQYAQAAQAELKVQLLTEDWQTPDPEEAQLLALGPGQIVRNRQVYLCCQQQVWVFARTLIPLATLLAYPSLQALGNQALGDILFANQGLKRELLQLAYIPPGHFLHQLASQRLSSPLKSSIWARRSVFKLADDKQLLVIEAFLPKIIGWDMFDMIEVNLNGSSSQFEAGTTILVMLNKLELAQKRIAVEVNQEIIPRSQFAHYQLKPNDKIEIIQAIGGG